MTRWKKIVWASGIYLALVVLALLFLAPILFMASGSLKPDSQVLLEAGSLKALFPSTVYFNNFKECLIG